MQNPDPASPLEIKFPADRDGQAWLYEPTHTYIVNGTRVHNSVTKIIGKHFPKFQLEAALSYYESWKANKNSKYGMLIRYLQVMERKDDNACRKSIAALWKREGELSSAAGTAMHRDFQFICEGKPPPQGDTNEVTQFNSWMRDFSEMYKLDPWRAEWVIYLKHQGRIVVCGQVDLVMKHREREEYWCIDYKRKDPTPKYAGGPQLILGEPVSSKFDEDEGVGPFEGLPATDFSKYTAQLNAYGYIAATEYGIDFRDRMCLLQVHPNLPAPNLVRVERLDDAMEALFALEIADMAPAELPDVTNA